MDTHATFSAISFKGALKESAPQSTFFSLGDGSIDNDGKYIFERVASLAALSILLNIIIQIFMTKAKKKE